MYLDVIRYKINKNIFGWYYFLALYLFHNNSNKTT